MSLSLIHVDIDLMEEDILENFLKMKWIPAKLNFRRLISQYDSGDHEKYFWK